MAACGAASMLGQTLFPPGPVLGVNQLRRSPCPTSSSGRVAEQRDGCRGGIPDDAIAGAADDQVARVLREQAVQSLAGTHTFDEREHGRTEDAGDDDQQRAAAPSRGRVVRTGVDHQRSELHERCAGDREHQFEPAITERRPNDRQQYERAVPADDPADASAQKRHRREEHGHSKQAGDLALLPALAPPQRCRHQLAGAPARRAPRPSGPSARGRSCPRQRRSRPRTESGGQGVGAWYLGGRPMVLAGSVVRMRTSYLGRGRREP